MCRVGEKRRVDAAGVGHDHGPVFRDGGLEPLEPVGQFSRESFSGNPVQLCSIVPKSAGFLIYRPDAALRSRRTCATAALCSRSVRENI